MTGLDQPVSDQTHQAIRDIVTSRIRPMLWDQTLAAADANMPNAFGDTIQHADRAGRSAPASF